MNKKSSLLPSLNQLYLQSKNFRMHKQQLSKSKS